MFPCISQAKEVDKPARQEALAHDRQEALAQARQELGSQSGTEQGEAAQEAHHLR